jgi:hypothetical protein
MPRRHARLDGPDAVAVQLPRDAAELAVFHQRGPAADLLPVRLRMISAVWLRVVPVVFGRTVREAESVRSNQNAKDWRNDEGQ